ncbi:hypothetical protein F4821DRAFT_256994 [Hypoxylon rubiginosum]|uniref:Uncharacterized protein n=1 Tax=Hypoxylon rubiginosum TaxID=110542 RepID=A0ACC0DAJ0_9PEZI|nr:hypothetical protein F4821DRAFT_256994 [Hypoxylon rubiginosum]
MAKSKKAKKAPAKKASKTQKAGKISKRTRNRVSKNTELGEKWNSTKARHRSEVARLMLAKSSSPNKITDTENRTDIKIFQVLSLFHCYGFIFHYEEPIFAMFIKAQHIKVDTESFMRMQHFMCDVFTLCGQNKRIYAGVGDDTVKKLAFFSYVASRNTATLTPVDAKLLMEVVETYSKARREFRRQKEDESDEPDHKPDQDKSNPDNYVEKAYGKQRQLWRLVDNWIDWIDQQEGDAINKLFDKMNMDDFDEEEL